MSQTFSRKHDSDKFVSILSLTAPKYQDWCIQLLACHECTDVLDITVPSTGQNRLWLSDNPIIPLLTHFSSVPTQSTVPLKVGRFYLTDYEYSLIEFRGVDISSNQLLYRRWQMSEAFRRHKLPTINSTVIPIEPSSDWLELPFDSVKYLLANIHVEGLLTVGGHITTYKVRRITYDKFSVSTLHR